MKKKLNKKKILNLYYFLINKRIKFIYFSKKKNYNIYQIYLSKKNLNLEIVKFLKKKNYV